MTFKLSKNSTKIQLKKLLALPEMQPFEENFIRYFRYYGKHCKEWFFWHEDTEQGMYAKTQRYKYLSPFDNVDKPYGYHAVVDFVVKEFHIEIKVEGEMWFDEEITIEVKLIE